MTWLNRVHFGDCLETLRRMPDGLVQTCVTSPPYFGLRDYGHDGQIGLEPTPAEFVAKLVEVFRDARPSRRLHELKFRCAVVIANRGHQNLRAAIVA